jgi:16S rRNA G966 N2-methylase RsmD
MGGEKADMVFTDPPYGYEFQSSMGKDDEKKRGGLEAKSLTY